MLTMYVRVWCPRLGCSREVSSASLGMRSLLCDAHIAPLSHASRLSRLQVWCVGLSSFHPAGIRDRTESPYFPSGVAAIPYLRLGWRVARLAHCACGSKLVRGGPMAGEDRDFTVCGHEGHVRLQISGGRQQLVHMQTCERKVLEPLATPWALSFDAEGSGFIHAGARSQWVDEVLDECLCSSGDGSLFVITGEGQTATSLSDHRSRALAGLVLDLELPPLGKLSVNIRLQLCRPFGFYTSWDALALFKSLRLSSQGGSACKWASHGWSRWRSFLLDDVGLTEHHVVNRMPQSGPAALGQPVVEDGSPLAEQRSFSTHAVLALSARWCSPDPKVSLRAKSDRDSVQGFLFAMLRIATSKPAKPLVWTLFLDTEAEWTPPAVPEGDRPIDILMHGDTLNLQPLSEDSDARGHAVARHLAACIAAPLGACPLMSILSLVSQHRRGATSDGSSASSFGGSAPSRMKRSSSACGAPGRSR